MDDYLFEGTGEPDADLAELERLLRTHGFQARALVLPPRRRAGRWLLAAIVLFTVATVALLSRPTKDTGWALTNVAGPPVCRGDCVLVPGESIETGPSTRARLTVADVGEMDVHGSTRLTLLATNAAEHRLELEVGTIDARVVAPPRLVVVETPSANAVDLGCAYTLTVDDDGTSTVTVRSGWVSFESSTHTVVIPAGLVAHARPGVGPGTPFRSSSAAFESLVDRIDLDADAAALDELLKAAEEDDALTVLYASARVEGAARSRAIERLVQLAPEVGAIDRRSLETGNRQTFDAVVALLTGYD